MKNSSEERRVDIELHYEPSFRLTRGRAAAPQEEPHSPGGREFNPARKEIAG